MTKARKTRKFAAVKRMIKGKDNRIAKKKEGKKKKRKGGEEKIIEAPQVPSSMFFKYNDSLGPPYHVLLDTNFINFAIRNKIEIFQGMVDCLYAKCVPIVTDCVMAELEKMGPLYRVALRIARDPRFERLPCTHKGTYADDCLVHRVTTHRCYVVATCDKELKRRLRKVPGVPIMYIARHRFSIERLPEAAATGAPRL